MNGKANGITNGVHHAAAPACMCPGGKGYTLTPRITKTGERFSTFELCAFCVERERASGEGVPVVDLDFEDVTESDGDVEESQPRGVLGAIAEGWRKLTRGAR